ncbi:MAG: hypothetical protein H0V70_12530 [Ktedonobacteraceae bacterium]|nr:hypothetical protein [Ktedonobacteraceae bacterium]
MSENEPIRNRLISVVRFGIGKELQLYTDELVVTGQEEGKELGVPLNEIKRLILTPGDPNPSKLILMADMDDDTTIILAEGMTNARAFREMLPLWQELQPELQLDPPDMGEQLRQALNTRRAWSLTCYGTILLILLFLYVLYLLVAFIGSHVHH